MKLTTNLQSVSTLKMQRAILHSHIHLHGVGLNYAKGHYLHIYLCALYIWVAQSVYAEEAMGQMTGEPEFNSQQRQRFSLFHRTATRA
jgi:hypothetical protein